MRQKGTGSKRYLLHALNPSLLHTCYIITLQIPINESYGMRNLIEQILKFGVVGVIATVIDFGVMIFLTEVFGVNPVASATASFIVSLIFNYVASMRYVFRHREGMSRQREFAIFVVLSVIGLGINDLLMWLGTSHAALDYRLVKVFATAIVMIWNFVTRKIFLEEKGA